LKKFSERENSGGLCRSPGSLVEVSVSSDDAKPVHGEVMWLELVVYVGVVFFEVIVADKEFSGYENSEL
jgi:hypothetical protein